MELVTESGTELPPLPYRGIQPFRYVDSPVFFAREEETRHLLQLVSVYRGVMLYGDSGVGKSSLINAGLLPAAAGLGFQPERIRVQPRADEEIVVERIPIGDEGAPYLPSSFASDDETSPLHVLSCEAFAQRVRSMATSTRPLLVFDQFEELVTLFEETGEQGAQRRVTDMLAALLREALPVKLLFVFREDYLARVKPLLGAAPELIDQTLRLRPPSAEALPTIIRGPFERHPGHFERELSPHVAERLRGALADRFGSGDVSLSEVQTVCLRLWRSDEPDALLEAKGVQGLLEDYLGEELDRFPEDIRYAAGALLSQMVTAAGTRNVISADDLIEHVQDEEDIPRELLEQALDLLERESKLVRRERRRDLYLYEITSEFLVPWISRRRHELVHNQERRRFRRRLLVAVAIAASVALVAVVATVGFVWALEQRSEAKKNEAEAAASGEVAEAASLLATDPAKALATALDAAEDLQGVPGGSHNQAMSVLSQAALGSHLIAVLRGGKSDKSSVIAAGFAPGGDRLVTVRASGVADIWNVNTARHAGTLSGSGAATRAVFSRNGALLAIGGGGRRWSIWDVGNRTRLAAPLPSGLLALRPDGQVIALVIGRNSPRVRLFSGKTGAPQPGPTLPPEPGRRFASVTFGPDGRALLGVFGNGDWVVYDTSTGGRASTIAGLRSQKHRGRSAVAASLSRNGRVVAVAANEESGGRLQGYLRLYDSTTGRLVGTHWLGGPVTNAGSARDGRLVFAANDGSAQIWQPRKGRGVVAVSLRGHTRPVTNAAFSDGGGVWLATAGADLTARIWNAHTGELRATLLGHTNGITALAFSPNGKRVVTTSTDGTARLWRTLLGGSNVALEPHLGEVGHASFSRDGKLVITTSVDGSTLVARASTGELVRRFGTARNLSLQSRKFIESILGRRPNAAWLVFGPRVALSADGTRLIVGSDVTGEAALWDAETGKRLRQIRSLYPEAVFTDAGPKQRWALVATSREGVWILDLRTGRPLRPFLSKGARIWPFGVAVNADGRYLVTAEYDEQRRYFLRVWDVAARQAILDRRIMGGSRIRVVAIDRSGRYAAGGNWNGDVWIWRIADQKLMARLRLGSSVRALQLSHDGGRIVTAAEDNVAVVWNVHGGQRIMALTGHRGAINSIEFSPDDTLAVTASDDGTVRVWDAKDGKTRAEFRQGRPGSALDASFDPDGRRIVVGASDGSSDIYACPVCGGEEELLRFARQQAPRVP